MEAAPVDEEGGDREQGEEEARDGEDEDERGSRAFGLRRGEVRGDPAARHGTPLDPTENVIRVLRNGHGSGTHFPIKAAVRRGGSGGRGGGRGPSCCRRTIGCDKQRVLGDDEFGQLVRWGSETQLSGTRSVLGPLLTGQVWRPREPELRQLWRARVPHIHAEVCARGNLAIVLLAVRSVDRAQVVNDGVGTPRVDQDFELREFAVGLRLARLRSEVWERRVAVPDPVAE